MKKYAKYIIALVAIVVTVIIGIVVYNQFVASGSDDNKANRNVVRSIEDLANQADALDRSKVLIVGIDPAYPPFTFADDGGRDSGFDVEFTKKLGELMGRQTIIRQINWTERDKLFLNNEIDVLASGVMITPERKEKYTFSNSYMPSKLVTVVPQNSGISSISDLDDAVIGTQKNTSVGEGIKTTLAANGVTLGKLDESYIDTAEALSALLQGKVDAIGCDYAVVSYYLNNSPNRFRVIDINAQSLELAIALKKGNTELANSLNQAMQSMQSDNSLQKLRSKWFGN